MEQITLTDDQFAELSILIAELRDIGSQGITILGAMRGLYLSVVRSQKDSLGIARVAKLEDVVGQDSFSRNLHETVNRIRNGIAAADTDQHIAASVCRKMKEVLEAV